MKYVMLVAALVAAGPAVIESARLNFALVTCPYYARSNAAPCELNITLADDPRTRFHLGRESLLNGDPRRTTSLLDVYLKEEPQDLVGWFHLGQAQRDSGQEAAAQTSWRRAGAVDYFLRRGNERSDPQDIETAMAIGPPTIEMFRLLGDGHWNRGAVTAAAAAYRRYLAATTPKTGTDWLCQARVYESEGQQGAALDAYNRAAAQPFELRVLLARANFLSQMNRFDEAADDYRSILSSNGCAVDGSIGLAEALSRQHDKAAAMAAVRDGLRCNSNHPRLLLEMGILQIDADPSTAAAYLEQASQQAPDNAWPYIYLAENAIRQRRVQVARNWAEAAVRVGPSIDAAWTVLGNSLESAGDTAAARVAYQHALQLNRRNTAASERLAQLRE